MINSILIPFGAAFKSKIININLTQVVIYSLTLTWISSYSIKIFLEKISLFFNIFILNSSVRMHFYKQTAYSCICQWILVKYSSWKSFILFTLRRSIFIRNRCNLNATIFNSSKNRIILLKIFWFNFKSIYTVCYS